MSGNWWVVVIVLTITKSWVGGAEVEQVRVGGLVDSGSLAGQQCLAGMEWGIQDVNNDNTILINTRLSLHSALTTNDSLINAGTVLNLFRGNVAAVVAPMTPQVSNFVSYVADSAQVPLITVAGNDPSISMKHSTYSIQMIGSDREQMKAIASLLHEFHWREIVVIFEDGELGLSSILALNDALQSYSSKIVQKFAVTSAFNKSSLDEIVTKLDKDKTLSRVFLVHTSYELAQKIFSAGRDLGMIKKQGHVWIITEWIANFLSVADYNTMDSMHGVIGIQRHIPQTPLLLNISSRWEDKFRRLYSNQTHSGKFSILGAYCYDSILLIGKATNALLKEGKLRALEFKSSGNYSTDVQVFQEGRALFRNAAESNFTGSSSHIKFDRNGVLEVDSYDVVNVVDREIRMVGLWGDQKLKLTKEEITWPNGSSIPPSGYRKFRVGVPPHVVFQEFVNISNNNKNFSGFCIEMFQHAVSKLPHQFDYEFYLSENSEYNPDYNDLVEQVVNKIFDAVVADMAIVANRSARVDFTQPFTDTGLVIMVPIKNTNSSGWAFLQPFTVYMWLTTIAFVVLTAFLVWLLERGENEAFTGKPVKQVETSLWFSFSTIVFAQQEKVMTSLGKVILMIWLFVVLILNSSYTASLTSILTVQQLSPTIRDIETLRANTDVKVGHLAGSFVENYLTDELKIDRSRLVPLVHPEDYVDLFRNGSIGAIVDETPYIHMVMSKHCGEFAIAGQPFYRGGFGFLFGKGSPVVPDMTSAVLNITQNSTQLQAIRRKWFGPYNSSSLCNDNMSDVKGTGNDSVQLNPRSFWGLFVITTVAYCLLVSAYFGRKFYKSRQISTRVENVQTTPTETPLTTFQPQTSSANSDLLSPSNSTLSDFSISITVPHSLPPLGCLNPEPSSDLNSRTCHRPMRKPHPLPPLECPHPEPSSDLNSRHHRLRKTHSA